MENKKHSNNFFSGFLLGAVVGGLLVFLFATEKGRKIFKILKEEGFKGASELQEMFDEEVEEQDIPEAVTQQPVIQKSTNGYTQPNSSPPKQSFIQKSKSTTKRFFKGVKKN